MGIQTKIEAIRQQPEHVRMKYVLVSVFISMLFIGVLWIFSITASFRGQKNTDVNSLMLQMNTNVQNNNTNTSLGDGSLNQNNKDQAPSLNEWITK